MKRNIVLVFIVWLACYNVYAQREKIDLQGNWAFRLDAEEKGIWEKFPMRPC